MRRGRLARPNRLVTLAALSALLAGGCGSPPAATDGWSHYGASLGGDRYAAPSAITPESVERLSLAWVYRTGDATDGRDFHGNPSRLQATPILVEGKLIASTGFNRVFALDPATGPQATFPVSRRPVPNRSRSCACTSPMRGRCRSGTTPRSTAPPATGSPPASATTASSRHPASKARCFIPATRAARTGARWPTTGGRTSAS